MKSEKFTVLELWEENKIRYIHFVLIYAGAKISEGYRKKYGKIPEKIEVYEKRHRRTFRVNQYPDLFREEANISMVKSKQCFSPSIFQADTYPSQNPGRIWPAPAVLT